ncbi:GTPase IMAP family member 8-like [Seriola aureovittata]|uniref:GTPase IMAP family member 8-like n=1 Tax=Seriola aureovittata TaxID=2871759 RepID=UPI0024BDD65F|nr:GTPase IMAP family member 8-like [Seriola aureovittata]
MTSENLLPELRIVLIGKVGAGKTAVMNNILRISAERGEDEATSGSRICPNSYTDKCQKEQVKIGGRNVVVVDTPGLCQSGKEDKQVMEEIKKSFSNVNPGPHVILFVQKVSAFGKSDLDRVETLKNTFDDEVLNYTMVLFTLRDEMEKGRNIEELIEENQDLKDFVSNCENRYHAIDNTVQDLSQVKELLEKINQMVKENKGTSYSVKAAHLKRKLALTVGGSALVGAGCGGGVSHFLGSVVGSTVGIVGGAVVGGAVGAAGIVALEHIKTKTKK